MDTTYTGGPPKKKRRTNVVERNRKRMSSYTTNTGIWTSTCMEHNIENNLRTISDEKINTPSTTQAVKVMDNRGAIIRDGYQPNEHINPTTQKARNTITTGDTTAELMENVNSTDKRNRKTRNTKHTENSRKRLHTFLANKDLVTAEDYSPVSEFLEWELVGNYPQDKYADKDYRTDKTDTQTNNQDVNLQKTPQGTSTPQNPRTTQPEDTTQDRLKSIGEYKRMVAEEWIQHTPQRTIGRTQTKTITSKESRDRSRSETPILNEEGGKEDTRKGWNAWETPHVTPRNTSQRRIITTDEANPLHNIFRSTNTQRTPKHTRIPTNCETKDRSQARTWVSNKKGEEEQSRNGSRAQKTPNAMPTTTHHKPLETAHKATYLHNNFKRATDTETSQETPNRGQNRNQTPRRLATARNAPTTRHLNT